MPYIGTTPTKVVSRQSANVYRYTATAGQSVFTGADLDNNVLACNPADMIVHMNGLRLESTDYTATSASVTLTTSATAGDEVTVTSFVTFEVADTYTKTAADSRYVNTTGDTMTGTLALPTGGLTVGTDQLAVDSAGRVTMPYQPSFSYYGAGSSNFFSNEYIGKISLYNRGNHFNPSTGLFTAPIAGIYHFEAGALKYSTNTAAIHLRLNGNVYIQSYAESASGHENISIGVFMYLSPNDTVGAYAASSQSGSFYDNGPSSSNYNYFSGHLIG